MSFSAARLALIAGGNGKERGEREEEVKEERNTGDNGMPVMRALRGR